MNHHANGNGNGNGGGTVVHPPKKEAEPAPPVSSAPETAEAEVVFPVTGGMTLRGLPSRMTRHEVVFELLNPIVTPLVSETLNPFKIVLHAQVSYSGRAVVRKVLNKGIKVVCEASLDEAAWAESVFAGGKISRETLSKKFGEFVHGWQRIHLVNQDYKVVVADMQTFLAGLQLWLETVELEIRSAPAADRSRLEAEVLQNLRDPVIAVLHNLFEKFEVVSDRLGEDSLPAHYAFTRRQLHPFWLGAPFMHRTFVKPLGYAGDYEMMSMIVRNGMEGGSLFAKLINAYLLDQPPCRAVRNRVDFLNKKIIQEVGRVARRGQTAKVFAIACGPAWEAVNFIAEHPLADHAEFHLLDFNEETLRCTGAKVDEIKRRQHRRTPVKLIKNSVQNLLRAGVKKSGQPEYDLVYCSGLYDYLSDSVCQALNTHLYDLLKPGGLLVVGNFAPWTPGQNLMEHLMDWFLIYRDGQQLAKLAPAQAAPEDCAVRAEHAGANIFLEARKPE